MELTNKKLLLIIIFSVICIFIFPFALEKIMLNDEIFPFNIQIIFIREVWFGFIASYVGAIGTVILGIIALWQNKKYQELSNKSSKEVSNIQKELRDLTKETTKAIKILEKIELAKYYPILEKGMTFYQTDLSEYIEAGNICVVSNFINILDDSIYQTPLTNLTKKYNTYGLMIKNSSEKTILNFTCSDMLIGECFLSRIYFKQDILPNKNILILIINFPDFKDDINIDMKFTFNNLINEEFCLEYETTLIIDEDEFSVMDNIFNYKHI